jgi:ATP-dependent Clp protease ATP-binding subunit ClpC
MFERYTENARRTLFFARYEASALGSPSIETHHLLLGLIREAQELTTRIFAEAAVSLPDLRREIEQLAPSGPSFPTSIEIPFSGDSRLALQAAAEEAERFEHDDIGPEHLLLGLLRVEGSPAATMLTAKGLGLDVVRKAILRTG